MLFGRIPVVGIFGRIDGAKHPQEELVSKAVVFHLADGIMRAAAQVSQGETERVIDVGVKPK